MCVCHGQRSTSRRAQLVLRASLERFVALLRALEQPQGDHSEATAPLAKELLREG